MSKIWFCRNCGYEVGARGRCHSCHEKLTPSPLRELTPGDDDDEVGYRLNEWTGASRGRLIEELIDAGIHHRFEDEELVVAADDEERTDDLVADVMAHADEEPDEIDDLDGGGVEDDDPAVIEQVQALFDAAERLRNDPTDMQADGDVAQASAVVFVADRYSRVDDETWAAVGRVTRRLLAALGSDEALEDEISLQAGILVKLLEPAVGSDEADSDGLEATDGSQLDGLEGAAASVGDEDGNGDESESEAESESEVEGESESETEASAESELDVEASAESEVEGEAEGESEVESEGDAESGGDAGEEAAESESDAGDEEIASEDDDADEEVAVESGDRAGRVGPLGESVYELPEWLPEQRAQLSLYLDQADIPHSWEGGDLVVPLSSEAEVEALFDHIQGVHGVEDEGERYRALEELFAAADRLIGDPANKNRRSDTVAAVEAADGPTPLGLDDAQWWEIRSRARSLAEHITSDDDVDLVYSDAVEVRDMLRLLV